MKGPTVEGDEMGRHKRGAGHSRVMNELTVEAP